MKLAHVAAVFGLFCIVIAVGVALSGGAPHAAAVSVSGLFEATVWISAGAIAVLSVLGELLRRTDR